MTKTSFNSDAYTLKAISEPFATSGAVSYPALVADADKPNIPDGFPVKFSSPHSGGGAYITRAQMNGIGNMATRYEFRRRCGGVVTFDPAFAAAIGGYPADAILDCLDGSSFHKVRSLKDNNLVDFTAVGVDGVNWAYLNKDDEVFGRIFSADIGGSGGQLLCIFKAAKTGFITPKSSIVKTITDSDEYTETDLPTLGQASAGVFGYLISGFGVLIVDLGTSSAPAAWPVIDYNYYEEGHYEVLWNGYSQLSGDYSVVNYHVGGTTGNSLHTDYPPAAALHVVKDHWYGIRLMTDGMDILLKERNGRTDDGRDSMTFKRSFFTLSGKFELYYTDDATTGNLVGQTYDFSANRDILNAVADTVSALGGEVTNMPPANPGA